MSELHSIAEDLRFKALRGMQAFDDAWTEGGIPRALELHGESVIRAQVQYQAAQDMEGVLRGAIPLDDLLRELEGVATGSPASCGRMGILARSIASEEARTILARLTGEGATEH